jgi:hypothetical protein
MRPDEEGLDLSKLRLVPVVIILCVVGPALAACGSSSSSSTTTPGTASTKAAFCGGNDALDKATASVASNPAFLTVLKANSTSLSALETNAPAGKVGDEARALVKTAKQAIATNNPNLLNDPSLDGAGAVIDTYCGVDENGQPLPADFGAGQGSAFCSVSGAINSGIQSATSSTGVLGFLDAHQNLITEYASHLATLPSAVRPYAQTLVATARSSIAGKTPAPLATPEFQQAGLEVQLYCGQNM